MFTSSMSHKVAKRKILTTAVYIDGFGKEEQSKLFLNIEVNLLNA